MKQSLTKRGLNQAIHKRDNIILAIMAIPGIIALLLFNYLPMAGVVIAFKDFNPRLGIFGSRWCGWSNFSFFFTSSDALRTLRNTVLYSLMFIVVDVIFGLLVAIALYCLISNRARQIYNTVMILPRFLSMVLVAYIVYGLLAPNGVVNHMIEILGIKGVMFYTKAGYWPLILTITHIWSSVGMGSIMYLASLSSLDVSLIEAARIDGAKRWDIVWNVYIPHLYPIISILIILATGSIFQGDFGLFYQVTMDSGTLYSTTDIIPTYVYRGLAGQQYAVSAAVGLFQSVAGFIMVVLSNVVVRRLSPENSLF